MHKKNMGEYLGNKNKNKYDITIINKNYLT